MFFDQQDYVCAAGMFCYPDFAFGDLPKQPDEILTDAYIQGSSDCPRSITGSVG